MTSLENDGSGLIPPAGIRTYFDGTWFRSRLEAHYAALFSLIGWEYVYEPVDGDRYIPDFLIQGEAPFFVEVKPAITEADYRAPVPKIVKGIGSYWERDLLIVGASPLMRGDLAGVLVDFLNGPTDWHTSHAAWIYCPECVSLGISTDSTAGHMRPCGHTAPKGGEPVARHPVKLWAMAGNIVQWRAA